MSVEQWVVLPGSLPEGQRVAVADNYHRGRLLGRLWEEPLVLLPIEALVGEADSAEVSVTIGTRDRPDHAVTAVSCVRGAVAAQRERCYSARKDQCQ